jgi:hypothetical protein
MRSANLQLTIANERFSITPLSATVARRCTSGESCQQLASHRLLTSRPPAGVELLCDAHAIEWAGDNGLHVTTARFTESAA